MTGTTVSTRRADYGIDAPKVIRNLLAVGAAGAAAFITTFLHLWSGILSLRIGGQRVIFPISDMGLKVGIPCGALGLWMLYDALIGKAHRRDRLLDKLPWRGDERVLDVGCGRGLMMIGAAKRLVTGTAVGVDLWQAEDLSGNRPEATLENARREGVGQRVEVRTGDMRHLPFDDASFDMVVSRAAIHNVYDMEERAWAVREIARVLKPGGRVLIDDIRHCAEYEAVLASQGCTDFKRLDFRPSSWLAGTLSFNKLQPGTFIARKKP